MHIFTIFLWNFLNDDTMLLYDTLMFAVIPFKDGCISLLLARLYYYQGTSEKRCEKDQSY